MTKLRRRQTDVEAYLHDGSDERAFAITNWIRSRGGEATYYYRGTTDYTEDFAVIRLNGSNLTNLVVPNFWVVDMLEGNFVAVPASVMELAYDVIEESESFC